MRARRTLLSLTALVLAAAGVLVGASPASAATGFETVSDPTIDQPVGMAAAPDGTLWFANYNGDSVGSHSQPCTEMREWLSDGVRFAGTSNAGSGNDGKPDH